MRNITAVLVAAAALVASAACTVHETSIPPVSGPSELSTSLRMTATPSAVPQDGATPSRILIQSFDAAGAGVPNLAIQLTLVGPGVLSASSVVTASDGRATVVFTPLLQSAPPTTATIRAVPASLAGGSFQVSINLLGDQQPLPTVPTSAPPTADFTFSPTKPVVGQEVNFNASASKAVAGRAIKSYTWDFGDGTNPLSTTTTSPFNTKHAYTLAGAYAVTLTVTDDANAQATKTTTIDVGLGLPTVSILLTKTGGQGIQADASGSVAAGSATITSYTFIWGDGVQTGPTSIPVQTHAYPALVPPATSQTFTVTVRVVDSVGRTGTGSQTITVP